MSFTTGMISRSLSLSAKRSKINEFIVVGAGLMGAGVAQVGAQTGHKVTLVDLSPDLLKKSETRINESIKRVAKKKHKEDPAKQTAYIDAAMSNLTMDTSVNKALASADLLVEAVSENMALKQKLFKQWDAEAPAKTILASNTSTLSVATIVKDVNPGRLAKIGGLHFFNPVPMMKLLEVIRIEETSDDTFKAMMAWGKAMEKTTVACKDTPGFIVNRLLVPFMGEAIGLVERGDASFADVDVAMKLGAGHPMGPFELMDYTGLDLHAAICENPNNPLPIKPSPLIRSYVDQGKLGRKSGEGFYKYSK